mmetsp:Transcript_115940/g.334805  ORF Transcript_115940/g.334805 Transcript_115940/m.334805 type:complete len:235 (+) Transcript_115940:789-1493(+)
MQVLDRADRPSDVKLRMLRRAEEVLAVVRREELSAQCGLHEEVEALAPIVRLEEPDDEGRVHHGQDALLVSHTLLHAALEDVALTDGLERIGLLRARMLNQVHGAEASATQEAQRLQLGLADHAELPHARALAEAAALQEVLEGTEQHVAAVDVQPQHLRRRHGGDRRRARVAGDHGAIAEDMQLLAVEPRLEGRSSASRAARGDDGLRHLAALLYLAHAAKVVTAGAAFLRCL